MSAVDPTDDELDGCDIDFAEHAVDDDVVPYVALFAGVDEADVEAHAAQLRELLEGGGA